MEYFKGLIGMLILADVILSFFLVSSPSGPTGYCILGTQCDSVQSSQYGEIFGIKLGWFGFIAFSCLLLIYILTEYKKIPNYLFTLSAIAGTIFAIYFIYLQLFVLGKICSTCMVIDGFMIIIGIISVYSYLKKKKN